MRPAVWIQTSIILLLMMMPMAIHAEAGSDIDAIVSGIEKRYADTTMSARFHQTSLLKAMEISDTAEGRLTIQSPGAMRWEYETPEPQVVITNGEKLWIYRPEDRQVMVGKAPTFFGAGKGASFLSDIGKVRDAFDIETAQSNPPDRSVLRLVPKEKHPDVTEIQLSVNNGTFEIEEIVTTNAYGDETRIRLSEAVFGLALEPGLFDFSIPKGTDVVQIEE